jgi:hypothetical protein
VLVYRSPLAPLAEALQKRIVRDSKNHAGPRLTFSAEQWRKFAASIKN